MNSINVLMQANYISNFVADPLRRKVKDDFLDKRTNADSKVL